MTWRVLTLGTVETFGRLSESERTAVLEDLAPWVDDGPPRLHPRDLAGATLFSEPLACGYTVTYFVSDAQHYVAVVDVARTRPT